MSHDLRHDSTMNNRYRYYIDKPKKEKGKEMIIVREMKEGWLI